MTKTKLSLLAIAATVLLGIAACTKTNTTTTPSGTTTTTQTVKDKLIGSWLETHAVTDANANNAIDNSEKVPTAAGEEYILTFKADGSGIYHAKDSTFEADLPYTWQLKDNDTRIYMNFSLFGESGTTEIVSLTATEFSFWTNVDSTNSPREWLIYKKQ